MKTRPCASTRKRNKKKEKIKNVTVIIVYHTFVARMKSLGPTALIPFKRNKLIDNQISTLNKVFDKLKIVIAAGYGAYEIYNHISENHIENDVRIVENSNFFQSSPSETISLALNNINSNNVLIIDGSLIVDEKRLRKLDFNRNSTLFYKENNNLDEAGINVDETNRVEHFALGASRGWQEIIFLKYRKDINHLREVLSHENNRKKFVFEALNWLIDNKNFKIHGIQEKSELTKITSLYVYNEIERRK